MFNELDFLEESLTESKAARLQNKKVKKEKVSKLLTGVKSAKVDEIMPVKMPDKKAVCLVEQVLKLNCSCGEYHLFRTGTMIKFELSDKDKSQISYETVTEVNDNFVHKVTGKVEYLYNELDVLSCPDCN